MRKRTSPAKIQLLGRVLWADYLSLFGTISLGGLWILFLLVHVLRIRLPVSEAVVDFEIARIWLWGVALISTIGASPLIFLRIWKKVGLLLNGNPAPGRILDRHFFLDHGLIRFTYTAGQTHHTRRMVVHRTRRIQDLRPLREVLVLVDPDHPDRAVIRDMYLSENEIEISDDSGPESSGEQPA